MRRRGAFSLLTGVALLGAIARFNEMTPDAQASFLDDAAGAVQAWLQGAVAAYNGTATEGGEPSAAAPDNVKPATEGQKAAVVAPARAADTAADASGNPLWALPLAQLSTTRERPLFSPSRRPPPPPRPAYVAPVAIQQPVKPPEPERPTVSLLGTIIGTSADDRLAVFLESGTLNVVRLRMGEDHNGWVLRLVKPREATLVKDSEAVVLEMAPPGEPPPPGMLGTVMPTLPPAVPTVTPGLPGASQPGRGQPARARPRR
ncbi:MAG: hypothetical protein J2P53_15560 [Bradyrhizobiaceae bacterium]|nr:hypothetical protein [Bradyrhizobiaceae bacterium]